MEIKPVTLALLHHALTELNGHLQVMQGFAKGQQKLEKKLETFSSIKGSLV